MARNSGHDAVHATDVGLDRASDSKIIALASTEARTIVTADLDYPRLLVLAGASEPSLIPFRGGNWTEAEVVARMTAILASVGEPELRHSILVVERDRVRRRRLPIA